MIERTAEFNAQVLAFLTGDARYLDYAEKPRESEDELEYAEEAEETDSFDEPDVLARDGEAPPTPAGPPEETADPFPRDAGPDGFDAEPAEERPTPEERPNVFRRRGGGYSEGNGEDPEQPEASLGDGIEDEEHPRNRPERTPQEGDVIPQLPDDLFDWPEPPGDYRTRERPRAGYPEERGDDSDEPEDPYRS
jgi:hypothetical protein